MVLGKDLYQRLMVTMRRSLAGSEDLSLLDHMHWIGNTHGALLYAPLFCPQFIDVDGSVLLVRPSGNIEERFLEAKKNSDVSLAELESNFNYIEVGYLFADRPFPEEDDELLAEFIV